MRNLRPPELAPRRHGPTADVAAAGPPSAPGAVGGWIRRTLELQGELAAIAEVAPWWWLLAGVAAAAEARTTADVYLACDAAPDGDTFMGYPAAPPRDPVADAIDRARAARAALRELDGTLPDQPLAVTIDHARGAAIEPSALDVAAFAVGHRCLTARLDDPTLPAQLAALIAGAPPPPPWRGPTPFVCVAVGDEPIETARHGHRRAWTERGGPWLGLGRAGDVAVVSTCHLIVDGYGHALITARIAELTAGARAAPATAAPSIAATPPLTAVAGAVPLAMAWRPLPWPTPRVIPLAYHLGCVLHRQAGRRDARFSPTIQIPVARGDKDDPLRLRRRVVSATTSVRFDRGVAEPYPAFAARLRAVIAREAAARGLVSRLLAAARGIPVPLAWKRQGIGATRPDWLERLAEVIGGRALLSRIALPSPTPPLCAVSSPARLASERDPDGGCVITIIDDGRHGAITACGSGFAGTRAAATALLDELLTTVTVEGAAGCGARAAAPAVE